MATSLLALLDDIATVLDDVALMTKVAAKKTAGVLGDDLALNAQQVAGVRAERELPVVWAVTKGSFRNKLILVPAALAISALAPWAIQPLLMVGGAYLCYEGFEKVAHRFLHPAAGGRSPPRRARPGARRSRRGPRRLREGQDPRRHPHRLHPVGRDHRDFPGHRGAGRLRQAGGGRRGHRGRDDRGRLRPRGGNREAGRRRVLPRGPDGRGRLGVVPARRGARDPRRGAGAHEGALRRGHRGHVPGGRRHPRPRHSRRRGLDPRPGPRRGIRRGRRRPAGGARAAGGQCGGGHRGRRSALAVLSLFARKGADR